MARERQPDMTKGEKERFDNIVKRITPKIEGTFGQTLEEIHVGEVQESPYEGEEIFQVIEIVSRGVQYNITVGAGRKVEA